MKRNLIVSIGLIFLSAKLFSQFDIKYFDKHGYLKITGGNLISSEEMRKTDETGMFAKNGYFVGFDYNHMIAYGIGLGLNVQIDRYNFNDKAFSEFAHTNNYKIKGRYASTRWGINALANIPVILIKEKLTVNIYGEANAGIRSFSIPSIDLYYNELENKWVEINYRSRSNTMGYLGFSGGIQFIISDFFGINISYNEILRSRHSIHYSVRLTDAYNNVVEDENYLHNYLDSKSLQFGILFLIGKK
jgi:hypothetical protein